MDRNIEIKARIANWNSTLQRVMGVAESGPEFLVQEDVFFDSPEGRLKLRINNNDAGELIYYNRQDEHGPKSSNYLRVPVLDPAKTRELFRHLSRERGTVRKHRTVYRLGATRIHLDRVEQLGDFIEFEVVLSPTQSESDGVMAAERLMEACDIQVNALVDCAYIDLLDAGV